MKGDLKLIDALADGARGARLAAGIVAVALAWPGLAGCQGAGAADSSAVAATEGSEAAASAASGSASGEGGQLADLDAAVATSEGAKRTLADIAGGRPLLINFWATWCPYCVEEMPDLQEIYRDYGEKVSFAFVDSPDDASQESIDTDLAWLAEQGLDLPVFFDTSMEAARAYGVSVLPTTVLIDADGRIVSSTLGRINPDVLRATIATQV